MSRAHEHVHGTRDPYAAAATSSHPSALETHDHLRHHGHGGHHHHSPSTTTTSYPLRGEPTSLFAPPRSPSSPPSFAAALLASQEPQAEAAGPPAPVQALNIEMGRIAKVLASLGYNEMASAAELLAQSPSSVATWGGAITVFAAPDDSLRAACPGCSRCHLLLRHMALGHFRHADLAAARTVKLLAASGFCLDVHTDVGPSTVRRITVYVDGVEISRPGLYDDGLYVVHGLHRFVPPRSNDSRVDSCAEATHHRRQNLSSSTTSGMRRAMAHLRDHGYGFVALAMRVMYAELDEKLANLTVFALDDQAIFSGGRHGYVAAVRFHIVPGRRLTRADLRLLRDGAVLPTLAGEDHNLTVTHAAGSDGDEVLINRIPLKQAEVLIHPCVAVHAIYVPFPSLHVASLVAVASSTPMSGNCGVGGPFGDCSTSQGNADVSSASEIATATPANKPAATTSTRLHVTEKVGRSGVRTHSVEGGYGAAAAAALVGIGVIAIATVAAVAIVSIALGLLKTEKKQKRHRKRQRQIVRRHVKNLSPNKLDSHRCKDCHDNATWVATCCGFGFCSLCVVNGYLDTHIHIYRRRGADFQFCGKEGHLVSLVEPEWDSLSSGYFFTGEERSDGHYMTVKTFVNLQQLQARNLPKRLLVWFKKSDNSRLQAIERSPAKKNLPTY